MFSLKWKEDCKQFRPHLGEVWYRNLIRGLKKDWGIGPNLFFIEYFPYHSDIKFDFPNYLPSYEYRDFLIEKAMEDEKYIIVMRGTDLWFGIERKDLGRRLKEYDKTILLRMNRRLSLSPKLFCKVLPEEELKDIKGLLGIPSMNPF